MSFRFMPEIIAVQTIIKLLNNPRYFYTILYISFTYLFFYLIG